MVLSKILKNIFKPKYIIMKGMSYDRVAVFFVGSHPRSINDYEFCLKNRPNETYWRWNKYRTIWTFKGLLKWTRLTKNKNIHFKALRRDLLGRWKNID